MSLRHPVLASLALPVLLVACQGGSPGGAPQAAPDKQAVPEVSKAVGHEAGKAHEVGKPEAKAAAPTRTREPANPREVAVSGVARDEAVPGLRFSVPGEWVRKPGGSPMRLAEFVLPGPGGDADLAVYRFAGGGGDVQSNVFRWRTQFTKADGSPLTDADGKVQESAKGALKVTTVDLEGIYVAQVTPGSAERYSDPNYRMLALIVEGAGDPYFFKAVGPVKTMALWESSLPKLVESMVVDAPAPTP